MLKLIPAVKKLEIRDGFLKSNALSCAQTDLDSRVQNAIKKLPCDENGAKLTVSVGTQAGEGYELNIDQDGVQIKAQSPAGAFYAIQTLRQIFENGQIPCLHIKDEPDFAYRGFYQDVTRGKIPTVATLKSLIDTMAYYKLNSLQLYVEHTFAFAEYRSVTEKTGYLTKEELLELGAYCQENFIDFIPSLSTFGHLYELLEQPQYRHLRVQNDFVAEPNFLWNRMLHHTIDPTNPESFELIRSLIDQYAECFDSEWFNICCDETFDLHRFGAVAGRLYVEFVNKIIAHLQAKGKKVMMWGDIVLKHPETIKDFSDDICFLNWSYHADPPEEKIIKFAQFGKKQIVCPGTTTWSRFCETVEIEEPNISLMAQYGHKHGAVGVLNTNWGDLGNPCSLELAMYGLVLGAEKSWSVATNADEAFYQRVNALVYHNDNGMECLKELSSLHSLINWNKFCDMYFTHRYGDRNAVSENIACSDVEAVQKGYAALSAKLAAQQWAEDEYRQEMLLAAEGVCMLAEFSDKLCGKKGSRLTDAGKWIAAYEEKWLKKNKRSELSNITDMFRYCDGI